MAKTKAQKVQILSDLSDKIKQAKSIVFAKFKGLGVKDNEALRKELRAVKSEYLVAKKTLIDLAFKDKKIKGLEVDKLEGQIALVFGFDDEIAPAKIIDKFRKSSEEKIGFAGGILDNAFISETKMAELAKLPGRQELLAKIVGSINTPVSGLVNVFAGNLRGLVNVLKAVGEKK